MNNSYTFHVTGMHCASCAALAEGEIGDVPGVAHVKVSLPGQSVEVTGDFGGKPAERIAADFTELLKKHGYALSV
jgi:copper chaperone CopZ